MEDNIGEEYNNYWETTMFFQSEELDRSWGLEEAISGYYDSSSPDNGASSVAVSSKNKVSEKNRRKKLNDRLFALRAVVPNISKMDKASIVKDAIDHIKDLHEQERRIQAEIAELESEKSRNTATFKLETDSIVWRPKKKRIDQFCDPHMSISSPIEVLELRVSYVGVRTVLVSLSCSKRKDTIVKLCEAFETLKLKIITATITAFSGSLLKTVFVQADEEEKDELKMRIEAAIAALDDPQSPMSI